MHENISDFQVPMYNLLFGQIHKSFENILYYILNRFLSEVVPLSEFTFQIALITQFSDDITVSVTGEYLEASENVGVI